MAVETVECWPELPYKRLGFYTAADTPLFAGRGDDTLRCAALLAEWRTRLLLLHGATASGKSSFLRAGLIPHLESAGAGIAFARTPEADQAPVLFVRATAEPLAKLADAVYRFAARAVTVSTPAGPATLRLHDALPASEGEDAAAFRRRFGGDPEGLLEVLEKLGRIVPETLVLIIDQGEEVLTVDPTAEGEQRRRLFFDFLSEFVQARFDLKLLVALRTEYFGRFVSAARRGFRGAGIAEYYLDELSDAQVVEAILRPTAEEAVGALGAPRDFYRFTFDDGVAEQIVQELGRAGGKLPALQIVCSTLYDTARSRPQPWRVTLSDLREQGGVEGAIEKFIDRQIFECGTRAGLSPLACQEEVTTWKRALHGLVRAQLDGTVTTDLKRESALRTELESSRLDFDVTTAFLASPEIQLLRRVNVVDVHTRDLLRCFGLGHDTLGLVLQSWKLRHDRERDRSLIPLTEDDGGEEFFASVARRNDIALCLSGDGYGAMLFHVGALWRLNELGYLPRLARVCGVSAGAIVAAHLGSRWQDLTFDDHGVGHGFVKTVVGPIRSLAEAHVDFTRPLATALLLIPGSAAAARLADKLDESLYGGRTLQDFPDEPRFVIVATNVQTGSLFRFSKPYLADHRIGRVLCPPVPLATAVAASAVPPWLSLFLRLKEEHWISDSGALADARYRTHVHLTNGTPIDQLALETAWKRHRTLLISDGEAKSSPTLESKPKANGIQQALRIASLQDGNLRSVRRRQLVSAFRAGERLGAFWGIGVDIAAYGLADALPVAKDRALELSAIPASYAPLTSALQERLIDWGYAVCDAAVRKYVVAASAPSAFPYAAGV